MKLEEALRRAQTVRQGLGNESGAAEAANARTRDRILYVATLGELAQVPGTPFGYWAPKSLRELFQKYPPLDRDVAGQPDKPKIADVKQGLATADDLRFTRYWWEVPVDQIATSREETFQSKKWVSFAKGGKPFFHDIALVVNWANGGEEIKAYRDANGRLLSRPQNESFYFRQGLAWPNITSSARLGVFLFSGGIFSHVSPGISPATVGPWSGLLATLNSKLYAFLFRILDPMTHHREVGTVARLPLACSVDSRALVPADDVADLLRYSCSGDETATPFVSPWVLRVWSLREGENHGVRRPSTGHPLPRDLAWSDSERTKAIRLAPVKLIGDRGNAGLRELAEACVEWEKALRARIEEIQRQIDDEVYRLYAISDEDRALIEAELGKPPEEEKEEEGETQDVEEEEETTPEGLISAEEHIRRLVHYLAHQAIKNDTDGIVPLLDTYKADGRMERGLPYRVRQKVHEIFGEAVAASTDQEFKTAIGSPLDDWLAGEFFSYHASLYRLRPIIWQIVSRPRGQPAFSSFVYWHKLDADTLRKVQEVYLRPILESAGREAGRLASEFTKQKEAGGSLRSLRDAEKAWRQAEDRKAELEGLNQRIQSLLQAHKLSVQSRTQWVPEKVNEIVAQGYRPNRDYGVRVNIEPLKQAGILPPSASKVKG